MEKYMEKTDLQAVKNIAKSLLNVPVLETEYSPMIVSHPFTKCGIVMVLDGDDFVQLNITNSRDCLCKWIEQVSKQIDESENVYHVYNMLNDAYRLMFFDSVAQCLSKEDFSTMLGMVWVDSEYANMDTNVSKKAMLKHFKNADKSFLMSESELETYEDLEDTVIVYRGVSTEQKNNTKALSWTTSFGKAKWFSERWGRGIVYAAEIDKKDVLAYFDRKNEDEVVVDFNQLKNVRTVTKPQTKQQTTQSTMQ